MNKMRTYTLATIGLVGMSSVCLATYVPPEVSAESARASVTVTDACNMVSSDVNHVAEVENGRYVSEIGTTTFTVTCNDSAGFSIYAVGYTGDEIGGTNSTKLVGASSNALISTGTATSGDTSNWAMKLATSGTATFPITLQNGFGSYSAVPASYTKVATRAAGTDVGTGATGATLTSTYAAFVNSGQTADTYNGKVLYTLIHPASEEPAMAKVTEPGCIRYYPNGSPVEGTMGCQSVSASDTSITLLASNYSRKGYGFAGWSDVYDYETNPNAHFYGPEERIVFTAGQYTSPNDGLSLYAVWVPSEGSLQDSSKVASLCGTGANALLQAPTDGTADLSSVSALTDQRDNQTYAIAKLADGNCWMIENLRLENTGTDNTNGSLAQGYGGQFAGLAAPEAAWAINITTANSLYYSGTQDGTATIDIGTSDASYRFPRYNNINTSSRASSPTTNDTAMYSYGNYYTWAAAIADTTAYTSNNTSVTNTSICPTGWHLPKGGNKSNEANNEFWSLVVTGINNGTNPANYSSSTFPYYRGTAEAGPVADKLRSYPNNFVYSGYVYSGSVSDRGSKGYYWSSTAASSLSAYYLYLNSSNVYPGTGNFSKYYGRSVRCVVSGV